MGDQRGGKREGAGRKKGSKNKVTVAREAIAEVLDAPDPMKLAAAIHQRGYQMLLEMERIVLDPTQPVAARIMAAKVVLPFMLPKLQEPRTALQDNDEIVRRLQDGRAALTPVFFPSMPVILPMISMTFLPPQTSYRICNGCRWIKPETLICRSSPKSFWPKYLAA